MKSFNNNEMDFQEKLQKDTEIPVIVHERINQAYRMIENDTAMQKKTPKSGAGLQAVWRQYLQLVLYFI